MKTIFFSLVFLVIAGCSAVQKSPEPPKAAETPPPAPSSSATADSHRATNEALKSEECRSQSDIRKIDVLSENGGCVLKYLKFGHNYNVVSAKHGERYCEEALVKIKTHLEEAGFLCKQL